MVSFKVVAGLACLGIASMAEAKAKADSESASPKKIDLKGYTCSHPNYKVHIFSQSPLVVYLEDFITPEERSHMHALAYDCPSVLSIHKPLTSISEPDFKASTVVTTNGDSAVQSVRSSQSTSIRRDKVVACVEERALEFQGFNMPKTHVEAIQLVKYGETERYHFHTDWFGDDGHATASLGGNRVSSFFGYIKAENVTGGGTNFPALDSDVDERWCKFVDCDQPYDYGVTFQPIEGNAVFWSNLYQTGSGDRRTTHAGLPVVKGQKIGMNIWTRQGPVSPAWK